MVLGFGILVLAALYLASGISGRSLAEVLRGEVGSGFALASIRIPQIQSVEPPAAATPQPTALGTGGTGGTGAVGRGAAGRLLEVIHTPLGYSIDNGKRVAPYAQADHYDHVHLAGPDALIAQLIQVAKAKFNLSVTSFHRPWDLDSHHGPDAPDAVDLGGNAADMLAFARYVTGGN